MGTNIRCNAKRKLEPLARPLLHNCTSLESLLHRPQSKALHVCADARLQSGIDPGTAEVSEAATRSKRNTPDLAADALASFDHSDRETSLLGGLSSLQTAEACADNEDVEHDDILSTATRSEMRKKESNRPHSIYHCKIIYTVSTTVGEQQASLGCSSISRVSPPSLGFRTRAANQQFQSWKSSPNWAIGAGLCGASQLAGLVDRLLQASQEQVIEAGMQEACEGSWRHRFTRLSVISSQTASDRARLFL